MIPAPWHKHGPHLYAPMTGASGALTFDDAEALGIRHGALQLVRKARPYGVAGPADLIYLPLDDGGDGAVASDLSPNAWTAGVTTNAGFDNWRVIDGTSAFVPAFARRISVANFAFGGGNTWTIDLMVWIHSEKMPTAHQTLYGYDHATHRLGLRWMANSRELRFDVSGASGSAWAQTSGNTLAPHRWHHLRLVIAPGSVALYVNGVTKASSSTNHGFAGGVTAALDLAYSNWLASYAYGCALASFRIAQGAKDGAEIVALFSTLALAAKPQTALSIADLDRFQGFESAFIDASIASGAGTVSLYAITDDETPVLLASAVDGRTAITGAAVSALVAAQSFTLYPTLQAAAPMTPGPRVTGFGFSYRTPEVAIGSGGVFGEFQRLVAADLEAVFAFDVATDADTPLAVRPEATRHGRLHPVAIALKRLLGDVLEQEFRLTIEALLISHRPGDAHEEAQALAGQVSAHFSRVRYALPGAIFRSMTVTASAPRFNAQSPGGWTWRVELAALALITAP